MLQFKNLKHLNTHISYLQKQMNQENVFLVGGCIRDILLGTKKNPTDIDATLAGKPENIYKKIDKKNISHFMTEKFGTITLIPKEKEEIEKSGVQYEITPFRSETTYDDFRHPKHIEWNNDLFLDSQRRDFSINAIYYTNIKTLKKGEDVTLSLSKCANKVPNINPSTSSGGQNSTKLSYNEDLAFVSLEKDGYTYLQEQNLLIVQDKNIIQKIIKKGKIQEKELGKLYTSQESKLNIIIDPHHGLQYIIQRKIVAVGDPDKRFTEDALRVIRALRFVSVLNKQIKLYKGIKKELFDIEKNTRLSIKKNKDLVHHVAKERIKDELTKVFVKGDAFAFISLLDEIQLLSYVFPSVANMKHVEQPVRYHPFDTYVHTLLVLYEGEKLNHNYLVKLALLYHDVGKVDQFKMYGDGLDKEQIREILSGPLNHRKSSPKKAKEELGALGFSKKEIQDVSRYIAEHHTPGEILDAKKENRPKKIRKLLSDVGFEKVNNLLDICIADRLGQYNPMQNSGDISDVEILRDILKELHNTEGAFQMKDLVIDGNDLMKKFNLQPGPILGELLKKAFNWVINNIKERNKQDIIYDYLEKQLKNNK